MTLPEPQHHFKIVPISMYPDGRMDAENAAAYLGKQTATLANWRSAGTGPKFHRRGRRGQCWYYKHDLDAWLTESGSTPTIQ